MKKILKKMADNRGFTLVELLVVISIIGILATLLILQLGVARQRARDAKRVADINQVRSALELYFDDKGEYPSGRDLSVLVPDYIQNLPQDPLAGNCTAAADSRFSQYTGDNANRCYGYVSAPSTGRKTLYHIWAELERDSNALDGDADINSSQTPFSGGANGANESCSQPGGAFDCIYDQGQSQ